MTVVIALAVVAVLLCLIGIALIFSDNTDNFGLGLILLLIGVMAGVSCVFLGILATKPIVY